MDKKYLIITGASSGIGLATAELFVNNNWSVINISKNPCPIKDVINISADLSIENSINMIRRDINKLIFKKSVICIIHNACHYQSDTIKSVLPNELRKIFETNLVAPLTLNNIVFSFMGAGSSIIYVGSTLSEKSVQGTASYCISKHASIGMMRATCQDLTGSEIHTACICPGFTETNMLKKHLKSQVNIISSIIKKVCFSRLIQPSEIANLMLFSANSPVVNGSVLHANLGQIES